MLLLSVLAALWMRLSPPHPVQWGRAVRAIRAMQRDPERSDLIFELNAALAGDDVERQFQFFLAEPDAPELLRRRPSLLALLSDFSRLRALPPDTLGHAYLRLMEANGRTADGLRRESEKVASYLRLSPGAERRWYTERVHCVHDLLHVLTGYGQDPAGEAALLAFYDGWNAQRRRVRVVRFGMITSLLSGPRATWLRAARFSLWARRRGKDARIPLSFAWESALPRPLDEVRAALRIDAPRRAHPEGVLQGGVDTPWRAIPFSEAPPVR
ncbi:MAG: Coq4 family protein [Myxococcota bacterium]